MRERERKIDRERLRERERFTIYIRSNMVYTIL